MDVHAVINLGKDRAEVSTIFFNELSHQSLIETETEEVFIQRLRNYIP